MVLLNIRKGIAEEMDFFWEDKHYLQKLDYEGISFRCHRCHVHGHNASQYPFPFNGQGGGSQRWTQKKKGVTQEDIDISSPLENQGRAE